MKLTIKSLLCIVSSLTFLTLCGCNEVYEKKTQTVEQDTTIDIYTFTNMYDNTKKSDISLKKEHQKTVNEIIDAFDVFLTEQHFSDFPKVTNYAKKHNWTVEKIGSPDYKQYYSHLNDGSGVKILFERFEFDKSSWEIYIWNLTEQQCNYMINHYKYNQKIKAKTGQYGVNPGNLYMKTAYCNEMNEKRVAVNLVYEGKLIEPSYENLNKKLTLLFNKDYQVAMDDCCTNLYFTDKPVSYKDFIDGVKYAINTKNNNVTIGALSKKQCEEFIYKLPDEISYNINNHNKCSIGYNIIEFSQK